MLRRLINLIGVVAVLCVAWVVYSGAEGAREDKIRADMDTRLNTFNSAKQVAFEVEKLILMDNQEEYAKQALYFKSLLDQNVYNEYFPSDTYGGGDKDIELQRKDMRGSIEGKKDFVFKYDALIVEGNKETPLSLLVFIKSNKIVKIKSLG